MRIAVVLLGILLFSSYFLIAQVKEDIIQKHISAIGGEKNWQSIKTITTSATRQSEGLTIEEKKQVIPDKAIRIDYKYKGRDEVKSKKNYFIIVNENRGWKYLPDNIKDTIIALNAEEIKYYKNEGSLIDPFIQNEKNGLKIEYLNKERIEDNDYFKFSVNYTGGKSEYVYIDTKTYLISKKISIGNDSETELDFEDYKKVNSGIILPYKISSDYETFLLTDIKINAPLDEQIFKPDYK